MLFTIPYNNSDPELFLTKFEPFQKHIHSFYFGLPGVFDSHNPTREGAVKLYEATTNTYNFLQINGGRCKTVLCLNTLAYPMSYERLAFQILRELEPLVYMGLTAVNVASPSVAKIIHDGFPELDIQTSCNTYTYITNMYKLWNEEFGSTVFNLPREALRTPWLLEQFKETGFISKCIVNEGCIYACPGNIEHACSFVMPESAVKTFCDHCRFRLSDVFKSNFVPPHRMNEFENKIDIAKIAGRSFPTERIFKVFLAYLNRDEEADVLTLLHSRTRRYLLDNKIKLKAKEWPKKTLTCECKECTTCNICQKAMEHVVARNGADPAALSIPI